MATTGIGRPIHIRFWPAPCLLHGRPFWHCDGWRNNQTFSKQNSQFLHFCFCVSDLFRRHAYFNFYIRQGLNLSKLKVDFFELRISLALLNSVSLLLDCLEFIGKTLQPVSVFTCSCKLLKNPGSGLGVCTRALKITRPKRISSGNLQVLCLAIAWASSTAAEGRAQLAVALVNL